MIQSLRLDRRQVAPALAALAACAFVGALAGVRAPIAPLIGVAVALAGLSLAWRRGVLVLLVVLPFSGVPVFMAGESGLAVRDVAIVLPVYAGFALWMTSRRETVLPRVGVALPALALFAVLVVAHVAGAPSLLVGAIGAKVWLAYLPMLAVGYHFVRKAGDFDRAMKLTALIGLVPAAIALAEWFIAARYPQAGVWSNNFGPFRHLYGSWYAQVQANGLALPVGSHTFVVPRVPSTFTSSTQFYLFGMVAYAAGLSKALRTGDWRWGACAAVLALGAIASGQRQAYLAVPALAVASVVLGAPDRARLIKMLLAGAAVVAVLFASASSPLRVVSVLPAHVREAAGTGGGELRGALATGAVGHGTGWDTQAALRYGGSASKRYVENWYGKASLELGVAGLAAIAIALASLQWRLLAGLRRMDGASRRAAAPLCALLALMTATLFKGPVLDLDPMNVYFWLLTGMLLAYIACARRDGDGARAEAAVPA